MHRYTITWVILFAVIAGMFVQLPQMAAKQDAVINTYSALVEVDALTHQKFVEPIDNDRLVDGAIRGMMLQLDPYSGYISPEELPAFERRTHGNFIGVGIELGIRDGFPTIIAPIEGSPAQGAGVQPGDVILAIDDVELKGVSVFDIEQRLGGPPGTAVRLSVRRAGQLDPIDLSIMRGPVTLSPVRGWRRNPAGGWDYMLNAPAGIAYVRVTSFPDTVMRDFDAALGEILAGNPRALILDLRSNPGGLLEQAVEMVDRFVASGVIVSTVTRRQAVQEYLAREPNTIVELPLAVLIDHASASSAEIVAGSLQDHERAVVIGERSFGKGSVQHMIRLAGHPAAVKLTVAYYRLPRGRVIHRTSRGATSQTWGVQPDIAIDNARRQADKKQYHSPAAATGHQAGLTEAAEDAQLQAALDYFRRRFDGDSAPEDAE